MYFGGYCTAPTGVCVSLSAYPSTTLSAANGNIYYTIGEGNSIYGGMSGSSGGGHGSALDWWSAQSWCVSQGYTPVPYTDFYYSSPIVYGIDDYYAFWFSGSTETCFADAGIVDNNGSYYLYTNPMEKDDQLSPLCLKQTVNTKPCNPGSVCTCPELYVINTNNDLHMELTGNAEPGTVCVSVKALDPCRFEHCTKRLNDTTAICIECEPGYTLVKDGEHACGASSLGAACIYCPNPIPHCALHYDDCFCSECEDGYKRVRDIDYNTIACCPSISGCSQYDKNCKCTHCNSWMILSTDGMSCLDWNETAEEMQIENCADSGYKMTDSNTLVCVKCEEGYIPKGSPVGSVCGECTIPCSSYEDPGINCKCEE